MLCTVLPAFKGFNARVIFIHPLGSVKMCAQGVLGLRGISIEKNNNAMDPLSHDNKFGANWSNRLVLYSILVLYIYINRLRDM